MDSTTILQHIDPIALAAICGPIANFIISLCTTYRMRKNVKLAIVYTVYVAVAIAVFIFVKYPDAWQFVLMNFGLVAGAGQLAYHALPSAFWDLIRDKTTPPSGRHAAGRERDEKQE